jgi:hypothetical protein
MPNPELQAEMQQARAAWLASGEAKKLAHLRDTSQVELAFARGYEAARRDAWIQRSCTSKTRHSSQAKALASAAHIASARRIRGLHAYHCAICKGWHLTKSERRDA